MKVYQNMGVGIIYIWMAPSMIRYIYGWPRRMGGPGEWAVDINTGMPADFVHCFLLRLFVNGLIAAIPCVGLIYSIVDICFIFREDRRCIHDLLAQTCVVDIS